MKTTLLLLGLFVLLCRAAEEDNSSEESSEEDMSSEESDEEKGDWMGWNKWGEKKRKDVRHMILSLMHMCQDGDTAKCYCKQPPCSREGNSPICKCKDESKPMVITPCEDGNFPTCIGACQDGSNANLTSDPLNNQPCTDGRMFNPTKCVCLDGTNLMQIARMKWANQLKNMFGGKKKGGRRGKFADPRMGLWALSYQCEDGSGPKCDCDQPPCNIVENPPEFSCEDGSTASMPALCNDGTYPNCPGACADGSDGALNADPFNNAPCADLSMPEMFSCACEDGTRLPIPRPRRKKIRQQLEKLGKLVGWN